jgi:Fe-S cluster biogenesis protein NfuA
MNRLWTNPLKAKAVSGACKTCESKTRTKATKMKKMKTEIQLRRRIMKEYSREF